jgi:endonuclease/exonuclease/phosphatase family metal-dependent hydrolase
MVKRIVLAVLSLLLVTTVPAAAWDRRHDADRAVTVMTQNLYFGADLTPLLGATDQASLVAAVSEAFAGAVATDIPARMRRIADETARARPDLVGLQEAALWRTGPFGGGPATTVAFDFIELLLEALREHELHYDVVATTTNLDAQAPGFTAAGLAEIRLTDRDAILVRRDAEGPAVAVANVQQANFTTNLVLSSPVLGSLTFARGWAALDATVGSRTIRFVTTHLETFAEPVQLAQALELLAGPANTDLPLIFVCDCNSDARGQGPDTTATYQLLRDAGLADAWLMKHPDSPGLTCCQAADLTNADSSLDERIDLVLLRGNFDVRHARLIGSSPDSRTDAPVPLWPSDHAGVVATMALPVGP